MAKKLLLTLAALVCCLFAMHLPAQNMRDYQWVIGYDTSLLDTEGVALLLDFRETPRNISIIKTVHDFGMEGANTSMSDEEGNLLFYCNGCKVINAQGNLMPNGDSLNPGIINNFYCPYGGSPLIQGVIALPSPEGESLFYVLNLDYDYPYLGDSLFYGLAPQRLYYQKINMAQNVGLGAVVEKNQIAVMDTFARGNIQAVRHANGKDWWVIVPKSHSNCYFLIPITEEGIQPAQLKCSGRVWTDDDAGAQVVFSPDGKKYVRFNGWNGLNIFDFDTSTGDLSNPLNILFPNDTIGYISGVAVSSNSQYLYVCAQTKVYQFDLKAADIEASKVVVAVYDGYQNPYPTIFYLAALAPDGKIYISNTSSTYNLHVINKPNCPGLACDLAQHGIVLPAYNYATIPNMPHYRQSYYACDSTLVGAGEVVGQHRSVSVYPNPTSEALLLETEAPVESLLLFDARGREVYFPIPESSEGQIRIDVHSLLPGLYYLWLRAGGKIWVEKFVKI